MNTVHHYHYQVYIVSNMDHHLRLPSINAGFAHALLATSSFPDTVFTEDVSNSSKGSARRVPICVCVCR